MSAAEHDRIGTALDQRLSKTSNELARRSGRELACFDLLNETGAGLSHDLDVAGVLLEQRRKPRALDRADGREHTDDAAARGGTAGFTAGSMAMMGNSNRSRKVAAAAAVAVLQAITTAAAPPRCRNCVRATERSRM